MRDPGTTQRGKYIDIDRIRRTIDDGPYDAVVVNSPESVPYYSGFYNFDIRLLSERFHFVVWPKHAEPAFVVVERRKRSLLPDETFITDIVGYQGEGLDAVRALADVLEGRGVTRGWVGIEGRHFPGTYLVDLQARLPKATFDDAHAFIESVRLVKTPAEIDVLSRLGQMTTESIDVAFNSARPGDSERSIAARMQYELLLRGADMITAPVFGAGSRSGLWHGTATDMPVTEGMIVKTDFGGSLDGYYSDIARTAVMGRASSQQREMYARLTDIKDHIVDSIKPGMRASEIAEIGRGAYSQQGLAFKWNILGHGIGMGLHEAPQIYTWVDDTVQSGMTMMIEVGYTDYPNDSYHLEDLIVIMDEKAKYLTDADKHHEVWEIGV